MTENLTRSDHSKWKKMGEQWMTNMLVCQASSHTNLGQQDQDAPGLGNSNLGFSIASTHLFRTGASDAESCEDGIPDGHLQELSRAGEIPKAPGNSTQLIQKDETKKIKNILETVASHAGKQYRNGLWAYVAPVFANGERHLESHPSMTRAS